MLQQQNMPQTRLLLHPHLRLLLPLHRCPIQHPLLRSMGPVDGTLQPARVYTMPLLLLNHSSKFIHILRSQLTAILKNLKLSFSLLNKCRHEHSNWLTLEDPAEPVVPAITISDGRWLPIHPVDLILPMRRPHLISHLQLLMRPSHQHQLCKPPMHTA
jgi:hypothetical protein